MLKLARRAKGHFMTLIEIRVHLIRCKPGHISLLYAIAKIALITAKMIASLDFISAVHI